METSKDDLIFIVEDNETYSMMFDYILTKYISCTIKRFTSGEECMQNMKMNPSLVVVDYYLPKMNGLEILRKIKKYNPETMVVALTQQNDINVVKQLLDAGVDKYFHKGKDSFDKICKAIDHLLLTIRVKKSNKERVHQIKIIAAIVLTSLLGIILFYLLVRTILN